jgi:dephospho-CoA kinase
MLIAGLTGGMACGKSFVARAFADLGCFVMEADEIGHEVLQPGGAAHDAVMAAFGTTDRVFSDPAALARLNAIVHPAVRVAAMKRAEASGHDIVIYVAAILIESGAYLGVDKVIVVSCDEADQMERALGRPGATEEAIRARLARQMSLSEKRKFADYVIDTRGAKEDTLRQTKEVYEQLRRLVP